ncbi:MULTISPECIES: C40 family peptidase [unclassified Iodidimonas]|jgi:hypothetical protein|uniref:C40 family peptidase n=1 Tax=unclassified Iodidimonas TaxID=2626145 RepID=UPI002482C203|nr:MULTISPECIES: C40 family peptidase [unclassified Iodidimonas]
MDPRITPARPDLAASALKDKVKALRYAEGHTAIIIKGSTALRGSRNSRGKQMTELLFGERFTVYENRVGWIWGQSQRDGYVGYATAKAFNIDLPPEPAPPSHIIISLFAHLYSKADMKSPVLGLLPMTSLLSLDDLSACGRFYHVVECDGWISTRHVAPLDGPYEDAVLVAERFYDVPYLWGGKTASGIDCSGLVQVSMARAGFDLPRDSDLQYQAILAKGWSPQSLETARRGDLAFFPGHVGIMLDQETLLHANATFMAVTANPIEDVIGWVGKHHEAPFRGLFRPPKPAGS